MTLNVNVVCERPLLSDFMLFYFISFHFHFILFSIFLQLSSEVSGRGAKTKIRGRLKDKEEEEKIAKERAELVRKDMEAKYARWNKG